MSNQQDDNAQPGLQRDPDEWKTGDEPMTAAQRSYLETLCHDNNETFDENLTKAEASRRIDELQQQTGRGRGRAGAAKPEPANPGSAGTSGDEATVSIGPD